MEGTRCSQSVDAQGVVVAVFRGPFLVVDDAGRNGLQLEIAHSVAPYQHGAMLSVKGVDDGCQGVVVAVHVVAVQLHGKASACGMIDSCLPTAANAQVVSFRDKVYDAGIFLGSIGNQGRCAIVRMVVDDNQVEREGGFLAQHGIDGVCYGADSVSDRYDDTGFYRKRSLFEIGTIVDGGSQAPMALRCWVQTASISSCVLRFLGSTYANCLVSRSLVLVSFCV